MTRDLVAQGAASVPVEEVNALATRIVNNSSLFGDGSAVPALAAKQLAMIAVAYGLDPLAGEVVLYEGKPLVTLDGRIRVCADHPQFDGIEETRPATDDERKAFRVKDGEDMWVAKVWRKGVRFPSVGYGRAGGPYERNALVAGSKRTGYNPERGPELARKRAVVNALRLMFPMPRPKLGGDFGAIDYVVEGAPGDTGDVIEGVARAIPDETSDVTRAEIAAVHATAAEVGYTEDGYRDRLQEMFGVRSATQLSKGQLQAAIATFKAERDGSAHDAAQAAADAALDATVAAAKATAKEAGRKVGDALVVPDTSDEDRRSVGALDEPPTQNELDQYVNRLQRAGALGIDLAPFDDALGRLTAAQLGELRKRLDVLISENEPAERLI